MSSRRVAGYIEAVENPANDSLRDFLEEMYRRFNRSEFISPDPLEAVREYPAIRDREVAALIASSLAVGRAGLIVAAARDILGRLDGAPADVLEFADRKELAKRFSGFRYRFFSGDDLASLLVGARSLIQEYGSLGNAFSAFHRSAREAGRGGDALPGKGFLESVGSGTAAPALDRFVREIKARSAVEQGLAPDGLPFAKNLLPGPMGGSACKRPSLMLRWLVRRDAVDPGGWDSSLAAHLVQPMDTHMLWVSRRLGFIGEKESGNLATALAVTERFREISPADPVRYDFALTRPGIRPDLDRSVWFSR